jgi:radical SAM protein with 4Fe4S-binding SPASM domain
MLDIIQLYNRKYRRNIKVTILTNGSKINRENSKKIKNYPNVRVQISLDGTRRNNDVIRGKDSYKKIINAIRLLIKKGVPTDVSLTLTKINKRELDKIVKLCDILGVSILGVRRFVPVGRGGNSSHLMLSPLELKEVYLEIENKMKDLRRRYGLLTFIDTGCEEALLANEVSREVSRCAIFDGVTFAVIPNGTVYPCRRLPITLGNIYNETLDEIFFKSKSILHKKVKWHYLCSRCIFLNKCLGGARCVSYAWFGKLNMPDPQCWFLFNNLPNEDI